MNVLAVEEDWHDRKKLARLLKKAMPDAQIHACASSDEALQLATEQPLAAAFIDLGRSIHIPGYFLARRILALQKTNIVFTNYEWTHLQEAFALRVSGYLRKPLRYEDVLAECRNLRYPPEQAGAWREGGTGPPPQDGQNCGPLDRMTTFILGGDEL